MYPIRFLGYMGAKIKEIMYPIGGLDTWLGCSLLYHLLFSSVTVFYKKLLFTFSQKEFSP